MNTHKKIIDKQKAFFATNRTKSYEWRIDQLDRMSLMLKDNIDAFYAAVASDFKTALPEFVLEANAPIHVIEFTKLQLKDWMKAEERPLPRFLSESGHKGHVFREPYGATLVIGPFNAPVISLLLPAIAALSAGNTVVLKPHEAAAATSALLEKLIPQYFEQEAVALVTGGKEEVESLLKLAFDFIFFTGSPKVGKVIMRAAAENLTPVILELGGQNPAIVDRNSKHRRCGEKTCLGSNCMGRAVVHISGLCLHSRVKS
ncbi:aldehyde dehydrogenase family protein [Mucilaginibacter sp. P25]|uniref:aldehyde dehydrogenase family protein n=1 Tax=unclassified Mucilaginibacter TaxID=2617802 RepID=UPI003D66D325